VFNGRTRLPITICLLGVDGSGKTTVGTQLVAKLLAQGKRCRLLHYEYPNLRVPWVFRRLYRTESVILTPKPSTPRGTKLVMRRFQFVVYSAFILLDSLVFVARRFRRDVDVLILDRLYFDAFLGFVDVFSPSLLLLFNLLLPRPDLLILFDVSGSVAAKRKCEASPMQSEARRIAYSCLLRKITSTHTVVVNSDRSKSSVLEDVTNHIRRTFPFLI